MLTLKKCNYAITVGINHNTNKQLCSKNTLFGHFCDKTDQKDLQKIGPG